MISQFTCVLMLHKYEMLHKYDQFLISITTVFAHAQLQNSVNKA